VINLISGNLLCQSIDFFEKFAQVFGEQNHLETKGVVFVGLGFLLVEVFYSFHQKFKVSQD
jgi:hypothetical protein